MQHFRVTACCRSRVFLLGPSHHLYSRCCLLSQAQEYLSPIGKLQMLMESPAGWSSHCVLQQAVPETI